MEVYTFLFLLVLAFIGGCMYCIITFLEFIQNKRNSTLLHSATTGDTSNVNRLLDKKADINTRDKYDDTSLHLAIRNIHPETAEVLIDRGADINAKGALDDTPLHASFYRNLTNIVKLLQQKGADESLLNRYGLNPADMQALPEIERKIVQTAQLLTTYGTWTDTSQGRKLYDGLKTPTEKYLINSLVLQIIKNHEMRLRVLILAIKLGISGSEEKLVNILMVYGDKSMVEDYLNSGSSTLAAGGRRWAKERGYDIMTGSGSHRASWGNF